MVLDLGLTPPGRPPVLSAPPPRSPLAPRRRRDAAGPRPMPVDSWELRWYLGLTRGRPLEVQLVGSIACLALPFCSF